MALLKTRESPVFDLEEIAVRDFVRARYRTWDEPRNGLVATVSESELTVLFLPEVHLATRRYTVRAQEVRAGKWEIFYSRDLNNVQKAVMANGDG